MGVWLTWRDESGTVSSHVLQICGSFWSVPLVSSSTQWSCCRSPTDWAYHLFWDGSVAFDCDHNDLVAPPAFHVYEGAKRKAVSPGVVRFALVNGVGNGANSRNILAFDRLVWLGHTNLPHGRVGGRGRDQLWYDCAMGIQTRLRAMEPPESIKQCVSRGRVALN